MHTCMYVAVAVVVRLVTLADSLHTYKRPRAAKINGEKKLEESFTVRAHLTE